MSIAQPRSRTFTFPRNALLPLLAMASLGYSLWHVAMRHPTYPEIQAPITPSRSPYTDTIAGAGIIEPQTENIKVAAVLPGMVTDVFVKVGDRVERGTPLFRLDDRAQRAELATQRAQLAAAQAELARMKALPRPEDIPPSQAKVDAAAADLVWQEDQLQRGEGLVARKVWNEQQLIERRQSYASAKARHAEAVAQHAKLLAGAWAEELAVQAAEIERVAQAVRQAEVEIERLTATAPVDGTVLKVDVRPGEFVGTPPDRSLLVLGNLDQLHVRVDLDEQDLPRFMAGEAGQGYVRGDTETAIPLEFVRIEPYVEPKQSLTGAGNERVDTRVLQVIYRIADSATRQAPDIPGRLYVGQQIDVYLKAAKSFDPSAKIHVLSNQPPQTQPAGTGAGA